MSDPTHHHNLVVTDRQLRGWTAVVAVLSLVVAVIDWLAGISSTLSPSGREMRDKNYLPPGPLA